MNLSLCNIEIQDIVTIVVFVELPATKRLFPSPEVKEMLTSNMTRKK
jgi:hypothetical protein